MSRALLKKSIQILDESKPKPIFVRDSADKQRNKSRVKKKAKRVAAPPNTSSNSKVEENVKKLLKLSNFKLNDKMVQEAFRRSSSRHYTIPEKEEEPEQEKSVFTEEDFARFAAEYTG